MFSAFCLASVSLFLVLAREIPGFLNLLLVLAREIPGFLSLLLVLARFFKPFARFGS